MDVIGVLLKKNIAREDDLKQQLTALEIRAQTSESQLELLKQQLKIPQSHQTSEGEDSQLESGGKATGAMGGEVSVSGSMSGAQGYEEYFIKREQKQVLDELETCLGELASISSVTDRCERLATCVQRCLKLELATHATVEYAQATLKGLEDVCKALRQALKRCEITELKSVIEYVRATKQIFKSSP